MANKIRMWTKEELIDLGALDSNPRLLRPKDTLQTKCNICEQIYTITLRAAKIALDRGHKWKCKLCGNRVAFEKQKSREIYQKGRKFNPKTKERMQSSSRKRWDSMPKEDRIKAIAKARSVCKDKYKGSPLNDQSVREKILDKLKNREPSKPELSIKNFVESLGFETEKVYKGGNPPYEIDILIKEKNLAIEYNSNFYHKENIKMIHRSYHLYKTEECLKQNIQLIHIFGDEWKYRQNAVKDFISSKLGIFKERIYARKCEIMEVEDKEAKEFLDKYHIRGRVNSFLRLGLYYENKLVALATFSRPHRQNMESFPHLSRFACESGVQVIGGLSRLSKAAFGRIGQFITFVERHRSEGNSYSKAGYIKIKTLSPDYWYTNGNKTVSKQSRRKSVVNTPKDMTEREHAEKDGLYRIWDCGKYKFIYKGDLQCPNP